MRPVEEIGRLDPLSKAMGRASLPNQIEPCATNAECQRVHRSGRAGDIAVGT